MGERLISSVFDLAGAVEQEIPNNITGNIYRQLDKPPLKPIDPLVLAFMEVEARRSAMAKRHAKKKAYAAVRVSRGTEVDSLAPNFEFPPRPSQETNLFRGMDRVPIKTFYPFYRKQVERTHIGDCVLYDLLPKDISSIHSHRAITVALSLGKKPGNTTIAGKLAEAIWDTYAKIPGWLEPAAPNQVSELHAMGDASIKLFMNTKVARMQLDHARQKAGIGWCDLIEKAVESGVPESSALRVMKGDKTVQSITRMTIAYILAAMEGQTDFPPYPTPEKRPYMRVRGRSKGPVTPNP